MEYVKIELNFIWYYAMQIPRQNVWVSVVGKYAAIDNADSPISKITILYDIDSFLIKFFISKTRITSLKASELPLPIIKIESHKLNP